jgi:phenylacetate-CoA ligase
MALHSHLVRHVLRPFIAWRRGESAQLRYEQEFSQSQWLPADDLRQLQLTRLTALLRHAYAACPFYRERFTAAGLTPDDIRSLDDLRRLPVTEKRDIQRHGLNMVARNWPASDLIDNQTGGSTGQPLHFKLSLDRKCSRTAATTRHNEWADYRPGDLAAVLWGAPQDRPTPTFFSRLRDWLMREPIWLDTGRITETSLQEFHEALLQHRPHIILAYARSAVLFARWLEDNGLRPHRPRAVITTAEMLEDEGRDVIERVFGCRVFNRYGCREVSVIASECSAHSGLHVMAEGLFVEIETPTGPARPGEVGSILITDLLNHAMPLIRYRVGDMGAWAQGDCPCGRNLPRLERLAGRVTDFLVGTDGQLVSGAALTINLVAKRPSLGQVQICQSLPGEAVFRVVPGPGFDEQADTDFLRQAARHYLGQAATVSLEVVDEVPLSPSGKYLFSQSSVPLELLAGRAQGCLDMAHGPS